MLLDMIVDTYGKLTCTVSRTEGEDIQDTASMEKYSAIPHVNNLLMSVYGEVVM